MSDFETTEMGVIAGGQGIFNISKFVSGDTYNCLASTNLLTQEMRTLLGIVLRR